MEKYSYKKYEEVEEDRIGYGEGREREMEEGEEKVEDGYVRTGGRVVVYEKVEEVEG